MDSFNNNDQQGFDSNMNGQSSQDVNTQSNVSNQFGGQGNVEGVQPQYNSNTQNMPENKGLSIASLCCGIVGNIACFINSFVAIILGILAIVFGVIGRKKGGKPFATAGTILGIVCIVLEIILIIFIMIVGVAAFGSYM